jgi:K+-sensing histidine kinase KdpD
MMCRVDVLLQRGVARYLFALVAVAAAVALRILLSPLTGTGAPFALFLAAALVTGLYAGTGPGLCVPLVALPLAAYLFVVRVGHPVSQAKCSGSPLTT